MYDEFCPLTVPPGAYNLAEARRGEPGIPTRVIWQGRELAVTRFTRLPRTMSRDRGGSHEQYADRHYFTLDLEDGTSLDVYFLRRVRSPREHRWWARA